MDSLFNRSKTVTPGGVHSPVRSFKGLPMSPRFIKKSQGAHLWDVEDKKYIDFCMSFGPLVAGHCHPDVKAKIEEALSRGWSYGAAEPYSLELAEYLVNKLDHVEQIRFVNSGTEAVMTAIRLAKGITGKNKIIKFNGCFHGHVDSMLIKAGSGLAGTAEASSKGVSEAVASETLILDLDNEEAVKEVFAREKDIAAIIVEPLPANNGLLPQRQEFLESLRKITLKHNAMLIFDEVISGFRVAFGGMVEETGITPDIVTYGKIIGGGLPVGAICGSKEYMEHLAPTGGVYQAGTLSANPLAMTAGLATLKLLTDDTYAKLNSLSKKWTDAFNQCFKKNGFEDYKMVRFESLFWPVPTNNQIVTIDHIPEDLTTKFDKLFSFLLERGVYLSPNAFEVGFLSTAHDEQVLEEFKSKLC